MKNVDLDKIQQEKKGFISYIDGIQEPSLLAFLRTLVNEDEAAKQSLNALLSSNSTETLEARKDDFIVHLSRLLSEQDLAAIENIEVKSIYSSIHKILICKNEPSENDFNDLLYLFTKGLFKSDTGSFLNSITADCLYTALVSQATNLFTSSDALTGDSNDTALYEATDYQEKLDTINKLLSRKKMLDEYYFSFRQQEKQQFLSLSTQPETRTKKTSSENAVIPSKKQFLKEAASLIQNKQKNDDKHNVTYQLKSLTTAAQINVFVEDYITRSLKKASLSGLASSVSTSTVVFNKALREHIISLGNKYLYEIVLTIDVTLEQFFDTKQKIIRPSQYVTDKTFILDVIKAAQEFRSLVRFIKTLQNPPLLEEFIKKLKFKPSILPLIKKYNSSLSVELLLTKNTKPTFSKLIGTLKHPPSHEELQELLPENEKLPDFSGGYSLQLFVEKLQPKYLPASLSFFIDTTRSNRHKNQEKTRSNYPLRYLNVCSVDEYLKALSNDELVGLFCELNHPSLMNLIKELPSSMRPTVEEFIQTFPDASKSSIYPITDLIQFSPAIPSLERLLEKIKKKPSLDTLSTVLTQYISIQTLSEFSTEAMIHQANYFKRSVVEIFGSLAVDKKIPREIVDKNCALFTDLVDAIRKKETDNINKIIKSLDMAFVESDSLLFDANGDLEPTLLTAIEKEALKNAYQHCGKKTIHHIIKMALRRCIMEIAYTQAVLSVENPEYDPAITTARNKFLALKTLEVEALEVLFQKIKEIKIQDNSVEKERTILLKNIKIALERSEYGMFTVSQELVLHYDARINELILTDEDIPKFRQKITASFEKIEELLKKDAEKNRNIFLSDVNRKKFIAKVKILADQSTELTLENFSGKRKILHLQYIAEEIGTHVNKLIDFINICEQEKIKFKDSLDQIEKSCQKLETLQKQLKADSDICIEITNLLKKLSTLDFTEYLAQTDPLETLINKVESELSILQRKASVSNNMSTKTSMPILIGGKTDKSSSSSSSSTTSVTVSQNFSLNTKTESSGIKMTSLQDILDNIPNWENKDPDINFCTQIGTALRKFSDVETGDKWVSIYKTWKLSNRQQEDKNIFYTALTKLVEDAMNPASNVQQQKILPSSSTKSLSGK